MALSAMNYLYSITWLYLLQIGIALDETVEREDMRDLLEVIASPASLVCFLSLILSFIFEI